jgi:undecaprenyl-diphosphatase
MKQMLRKAEFFIIVALFWASFFLDTRVSQWVGDIQAPYLVYLMQWMTHLGSVLVVMVLMTSLFLWGEKKRKWIAVLWMSFLSSAVVCAIIKLIVERPRPMDFAFPILGSSFPSIHAAIAFSTVPVLDREFPVFKWFWILFAVGVGVSRVYFQYHYISDVFAGALIGYVIGHLFVAKEERGKYVEWFKRRVRWT